MKIMVRKKVARSLLTLSFALSFLGNAQPARAVHPRGMRKNEPFVELMDNLGDHSHAITTSDPVAQRHFDQGLRLMYAFNHAEAIRSFRAASQIDPDCAMAEWGIALALGRTTTWRPTPNRPRRSMPRCSRPRSWPAARSRTRLAFIDALSLRYLETPDRDRAPLDLAYAEAMRKVSAKHADNLDLQVLFAERCMDLRPWNCRPKTARPSRAPTEPWRSLAGVLAENSQPSRRESFLQFHAVEALNPRRTGPALCRGASAA